MKSHDRDEYVARYTKQIKAATSPLDYDLIINAIYEDGFIDGTNEGNEPDGSKQNSI